MAAWNKATLVGKGMHGLAKKIFFPASYAELAMAVRRRASMVSLSPATIPPEVWVGILVNKHSQESGADQRADVCFSHRPGLVVDVQGASLFAEPNSRRPHACPRPWTVARTVRIRRLAEPLSWSMAIWIPSWSSWSSKYRCLFLVLRALSVMIFVVAVLAELAVPFCTLLIGMSFSGVRGDGPTSSCGCYCSDVVEIGNTPRHTGSTVPASLEELADFL